jgi:hypothetical protein
LWRPSLVFPLCFVVCIEVVGVEVVIEVVGAAEAGVVTEVVVGVAAAMVMAANEVDVMMGVTVIV